ncbi:hypothetical protein D9611_005628 [Ephemerocybe angulata]|uniref:Mannosyltransferase n=1 Tax=Ephemerocybe angulata TaxID=980116 RepID=A0A8H5BHD9_9AGAR|nr:hypothetical protein D9611_005628 [Tulosesus angulatus]
MSLRPGTETIRFRRPTTDKPEPPKPAKIPHNALLHEQGYGFQTWELSPVHALRSWAYILLHALPARVGLLIGGNDKRVAFFAVRVALAMISGLVEAAFYRSVVEHVNQRVGRYLFFMLVFSAGMWNSSAAFLPSSFAMYAVTLASSFAMRPSNRVGSRRTLAATLLFATGAIVGWPFAIVLSLPFVFEELFIFSGDTVIPSEKKSWMTARWKRMTLAVFAAALIFVPVIGIDSLAYGKLEIVPWNIVQYNIFGGEERGPNLYGTSPWTFYANNLVLNFNILAPLALLSLPALAITRIVDKRRLGYAPASESHTSPFTVLALRLAPFYLWLLILTVQPHKEERFMFPAYPLLCFNAAVCLYLMRGWLEVSFIKLTKSPWKASQTSMFRQFTFSLLVGTIVLSLSRTVANYKYYHAPMAALFNFQMTELPRLLNATGLLPTYPEGVKEDDQPRLDLSPISEFNLTLCYGKEWHRFPGHFLVPNGIRVDFIKSEFNGLLPGHFATHPLQGQSLASRWWPRPQTQHVPSGLNDLNKEEPSHYVPIEQCDYLVDLDFPLNPVYSDLEPRYAVDSENWERVHCEKFLDARHSMLVTRVLWFPSSTWRENNRFGDYCILKNIENVKRKEALVSRSSQNM